MKKFKKALICAAACATALSMTALAACSDEETPSSDLSADVTVAEAMSSEQLGAQLAKLENTTACAFTLEGGLKATKMNNEALEAAITMASVSAKGNFEDGDADINLAVNSKLVPDNGASPTAEEGGENVASMLETSLYLRSWNAFVPNFEIGGYDRFDVTSGISESGIELSDFISMFVQSAAQESAMLLTLANTTDSITVNETAHTITLDVNKMIYGVYDYIRQIVNNITPNTTVSGLLKCSAVKYYIEAYTAGMTAQDLFDTVMEIIAGAGGSGGPSTGTTPMALADIPENSPLAAVMPLQDEGVYDYIVRLANSQDVATLLGSPAPIGATKIADMLGAEAANALDGLKTTVNSLSAIIKEDKISMPEAEGMSPAYAGMTVSGLKLTYTYSDSGLQSESFEGKIVMDVEMETGVVVPCEMEVSLTLTVLSEKVTEFTDITDYIVNVYDEVTGNKTDETTVGEILAPAPAPSV